MNKMERLERQLDELNEKLRKIKREADQISQNGGGNPKSTWRGGGGRRKKPN